MSYAQTILPEFDQEFANTRKVLECVPDDKFAWKAHEKMNSIGWNANHLVEIAGWVEGILTQTDWDVSPPGGPPYQSPQLKSKAELLAEFDKSVAAGRRAIEQAKDEDLGVAWSLLAGGQPIFTLPRAAVIRTFVLNHLIHHRAHLCVYLRLNEIPVPGMYGPTGS